MADTLNDGGFITGTYDATIAGTSYTIEKSDHEMPVGQADAMNADGTPKGGAFVRLKEKLSVTIKGQSTKSPPTKLSPFSLAVNGYAAKYWVVTNLKISSSNEGAVITTWTADLVEHVNTP